MRIQAVDDLGAVARQRRLDLGLSQAELARRAGLTRQWLVRFEQGNSDVSLSKAFAVLRELNLTVRVDPTEARSVTLPAVKYTIPKIKLSQIKLSQIDRDAVRKGHAEVRRILDTPVLLSEVRERLRRLDATGADQEPGRDE
jgi:transcriptional regulator with XRE-family HTH domain